MSLPPPPPPQELRSWAVGVRRRAMFQKHNFLWESEFPSLQTGERGTLISSICSQCSLSLAVPSTSSAWGAPTHPLNPSYDSPPPGSRPRWTPGSLQLSLDAARLGGVSVKLCLPQTWGSLRGQAGGRGVGRVARNWRHHHPHLMGESNFERGPTAQGHTAIQPQIHNSTLEPLDSAYSALSQNMCWLNNPPPARGCSP